MNYLVMIDNVTYVCLQWPHNYTSKVDVVCSRIHDEPSYVRTYNIPVVEYDITGTELHKLQLWRSQTGYTKVTFLALALCGTASSGENLFQDQQIKLPLWQKPLYENLCSIFWRPTCRTPVCKQSAMITYLTFQHGIGRVLYVLFHCVTLCEVMKVEVICFAHQYGIAVLVVWRWGGIYRKAKCTPFGKAELQEDASSTNWDKITLRIS